MTTDPPLSEGPFAITMYREENMWVIRHHDEQITTQGETIYEALFMLADALCGANEDNLEQLQETASKVLNTDITDLRYQDN